jgi:hypothetical protein
LLRDVFHSMLATGAEFLSPADRPKGMQKMLNVNIQDLAFSGDRLVWCLRYASLMLIDREVGLGPLGRLVGSSPAHTGRPHSWALTGSEAGLGSLSFLSVQSKFDRLGSCVEHGLLLLHFLFLGGRVPPSKLLELRIDGALIQQVRISLALLGHTPNDLAEAVPIFVLEILDGLQDLSRRLLLHRSLLAALIGRLKTICKWLLCHLLHLWWLLGGPRMIIRGCYWILFKQTLLVVGRLIVRGQRLRVTCHRHLV